MGKCQQCSSGTGTLFLGMFTKEMDKEKQTLWYHWEKDENQMLRKVSKSGCNGELLDLVMESSSEVQEHICVLIG